MVLAARFLMLLRDIKVRRILIRAMGPRLREDHGDVGAIRSCA
jgi:hypothetical protein